MTKLILYNGYHIGDVLFSEPLVRNFRRCNPELLIDVVVRNCTFLFSAIENIRIVPWDNKYGKKYGVSFFMVDKDTVAINMWVLAIAKGNWDTCSDIELRCDLIMKHMEEIVKHMNEKLNTTLQFQYTNNLLPMLPITTDISAFTQWRQQNPYYKDIILYFNYQPVSNQPIPVHDHGKVVLNLCTTFPRKIFIVAEQMDGIQAPNLLYADKTFQFTRQEPLCEHLCQLGKTVLECTHAIVFDIGACCFFMNTDYRKSTTKIIHASHVSYPFHYAMRVKKNLGNSPFYRPIVASDEKELLKQFSTILTE